MRISDWSSDVCSSDLLSVVVETSDTPSLRALVSSKGIDPSALQLETSADVARQSLERVAAGPTFFLGEDHSEPVNANATRKRTEEISAFDRKSDVKGKRMSVRVDHGGRRIL